MRIIYLNEMSQEIFRIGKHKHDKTANTYRIYFYDDEGTNGIIDTTKYNPALEPVHFHVSLVGNPDKSLAKVWVLPDGTFEIKENYLGDELNSILRQIKNKVFDIIDTWSEFFGDINTKYYSTTPVKIKLTIKREISNRNEIILQVKNLGNFYREKLVYSDKNYLVQIGLLNNEKYLISEFLNSYLLIKLSGEVNFSSESISSVIDKTKEIYLYKNDRLIRLNKDNEQDLDKIIEYIPDYM